MEGDFKRIYESINVVIVICFITREGVSFIYLLNLESEVIL